MIMVYNIDDTMNSKKKNKARTMLIAIGAVIGAIVGVFALAFIAIMILVQFVGCF